MTDSNAVDVYSFGILLWAVVTGEQPYADVENMFQLAMQVTQKGRRPTIPSDCPARLAALMTACWHQKPLRRPTFQVSVVVSLRCGARV